MMSVEVLVACMNQDDDSLYEIMNLQSNAVFANQCDKFDYKITEKEKGISKLVSTSDRGVGKNRNIALLNATSDILIIADEDMVYKNDYVQQVEAAFAKQKNADIIIFELNYLNSIVKGKKRVIKKIKKLHWYNSMRYGTARIAIKRDSLLKANIWFSLLFGGGAPYTNGEDCLFVREAFKKGLNVYSNPYIIADVKQESSTWFKGYTEKYFIDKGIWLANAFPMIKYPLAFYYAYRFKDLSEHSALQILKLVLVGIRRFSEPGCIN